MNASIIELASRTITDHISMFDAKHCLSLKSSCVLYDWKFTPYHVYCSLACSRFALVLLISDKFSVEWDLGWRALETKSLTSQSNQLLQTTFLKLQFRKYCEKISNKCNWLKMCIIEFIVNNFPCKTRNTKCKNFFFILSQYVKLSNTKKLLIQTTYILLWSLKETFWSWRLVFKVMACLQPYWQISYILKGLVQH